MHETTQLLSKTAIYVFEFQRRREFSIAHSFLGRFYMPNDQSVHVNDKIRKSNRKELFYRYLQFLPPKREVGFFKYKDPTENAPSHGWLDSQPGLELIGCT